MIPSFSLPCSLKPWSACECKHVLGLRLGSSKASPDNVFSCYRSTLFQGTLQKASACL